MTAICTYTDVYLLCKPATDVQTNHQTQITALIANATQQVEDLLGRKITANSFTDVILENNMNCAIYGDKLYLKGPYRDTYSITAITEEGHALTAITGYDDGKDYYLDVSSGLIKRWPQYWSMNPFAIKITGAMGIGSWNGSTFTPNAAIKQAVIEMAAAKSLLWRQTVSNGDGTTTYIRTTINKDTEESLKKFILRDI